MPVLPQIRKSWGAELQTLEGHSRPVLSVAFSPDGQRIVSGSHYQAIKLWDAQTGLELRSLDLPGSVGSMAFSPDGQRIVSSSHDDTDNAIKVWDAQTGSDLRTLEGHSDSVQSVAFSPDGQRIVSIAFDATIKLWDAQTGSELRTLEGDSESSESVSDVSSGNSHTGDGQVSQISLENFWVCWRGEKVLWLPPKLHEPRSAFKVDILVFGYWYGRVLIIKFCAPFH